MCSFLIGRYYHKNCSMCTLNFCAIFRGLTLILKACLRLPFGLARVWSRGLADPAGHRASVDSVTVHKLTIVSQFNEMPIESYQFQCNHILFTITVHILKSCHIHTHMLARLRTHNSRTANQSLHSLSPVPFPYSVQFMSE